MLLRSRNRPKFKMINLGEFLQWCGSLNDGSAESVGNGASGQVQSLVHDYFGEINLAP